VTRKWREILQVPFYFIFVLILCHFVFGSWAAVLYIIAVAIAAAVAIAQHDASVVL
jgi:hypothetical protein